MKTIKIYPTVVSISEDVTTQEILGGSLHEILDNSASPEREKEIIEDYQNRGVNVSVIVAPDGRTDESLLSRELLAKDIVHYKEVIAASGLDLVGFEEKASDYLGDNLSVSSIASIFAEIHSRNTRHRKFNIPPAFKAHSIDDAHSSSEVIVVAPSGESAIMKDDGISKEQK